MDDRRLTTDDRRPLTTRLSYIVVVAVFLLALIGWPGAAWAQGEGVIEGDVTVAEGETLPEGLEAELLFLPNGQGPPVITAQPLGDDSTFRFEEVDTSAEHRYLVRVTVDEEDNLSDLLAFTSGETTLTVPIRLFERTTDASALTVPQVAYVLEPRPGGWGIVALYRFQNEGERIIENLTNPPATIPLPLDATNVQFEQAIDFEGVVELPDGFAYTGPFPPGETVFVFSYLLPYQEGEQTVTLPLGVDAAEVSVLAPQLGQQTAIDNLASGGVQDGPNGQPFELFQGVDVAGTESFALRFTGLPPAPTPAPGEEAPVSTVPQPRLVPVSPLERLPRWAPLVPMVLAAGGVLAYVFTRPTPSSAEQRASLRTRRDTLVAEIAALDIRYEAGAMGDQTHQRQRETLKGELKTVLRQLGQNATMANNT